MAEMGNENGDHVGLVILVKLCLPSCDATRWTVPCSVPSPARRLAPSGPLPPSPLENTDAPQASQIPDRHHDSILVSKVRSLQEKTRALQSW